MTGCCVLGPQACDAWKKEAEEAGERASAAGAECELAREQRDALEVQVKKLQDELERLHSGPDPQALPAFSDLEALSLSTLYSLQKQLRAHLEQVDKVSPGGWGSTGGGDSGLSQCWGAAGSTLLPGWPPSFGEPLPHSGQRHCLGRWRGVRAHLSTLELRQYAWALSHVLTAFPVSSVPTSRHSRRIRPPGYPLRAQVP